MSVSQSVRRKVWERDEGTCQGCGVDLDRLQRLRELLRHRAMFQGRDYTARVWFKRFEQALFDLGYSQRHLWEADHIVPRSEGGPDDLENLRVLCYPCHKHETARLARFRRHNRKLRVKRRDYR